MSRRSIAVLILVSLIMAVSSCSSGETEQVVTATTLDTSEYAFYEYLGEFDYDSSLALLVYEPVEGEDEYGIQWRNVRDFDGIIKSGKTVMLYFYNSIATDNYGFTAGVEDIAQAAWDDMIVVMIDTLERDDLAARYEIQRVPEFVLLKDSVETARFEGYNYEAWTMSDVAAWVQSNGIKVDYSRLG